MRSAVAIAAGVGAGLVPSLAYLAIGLWWMRATDATSRGAERLALAYALGTGAASLIVLVLRGFGAPVPMTVLAAIAASGAFAWPRDRIAAAPRTGWIRAVDGLALGVGALTFVAALAPETYWDGFEYHLPMIRAWTEGPIRALPALVDAEFRAGIDLLYLPALAVGRADAAAAVSACFAMALAALVRAEVVRVASPGAGALAGLFTLIVPLTIDNAASTYVDLGVGVYGYLALQFADRWNRGQGASTLLYAAVFAAFAANAKLHAVLLVPAIGFLLLLGGRIPRWRALLWPVAVFAALTLPWFVKEAWTTGNPLFPLFGSIWGYGPSTPELLALRRFRLSTDFPVDRDLWGFAQYLVSIHFGRNPHVSGLLGPLPLALAPLAIGRISRASAALVALVAGLFALQFAFMPALRFGVSIYPFAAIAAAVGGRRLAASGRAGAALLGGLFALLAIHHLAYAANQYLPRVAALRDPQAYRATRFPDQVALADVVGRAEPVVAIPKGAVDWMPRPVYNLHWERNGELFFERTPPGRALALLRRRGVRSLVLDVEPPHPDDGATGYATVDHWIRSGTAHLHVESPPKRARGTRVWVRVELEPVRSTP